MANTILNFHFDYLHPSLRNKLEQKRRGLQGLRVVTCSYGWLRVVTGLTGRYGGCGWLRVVSGDYGWLRMVTSV